MKTFKLPPLNRFASKDKEKDPFLKFFAWVGRKVDPFWKPRCGILMDPSKVGLSPEDEETLYALEIDWAKRVGVPEKHLAWHNLMYGPSVVKKPAGKVYVRAGLFKNENNR